MRMGMIFESLVTAAMLLIAPSAFAATTVPVGTLSHLQQQFDDLGAPLQTLTLPNGRTLHYSDTGETGWRPVLFIGGTGTSARAVGMVDYLRSMRRVLKLRFIVVERNGFGDTPFDAKWGYGDYVADIAAVLDKVAIRRFALLGISGGGPYAAHIAAAMPDRIISVHLMAAVARLTAPQLDCSQSRGQLAKTLAGTVQNPRIWWHLPGDSPALAIPGFADRAFEEGARAFFVRGQMGDPLPEAAELLRYCEAPADVSNVKAPVFLYHGAKDMQVVPANARYWQAHFGGKVTLREYAEGRHDVQYRHWDQALLDLAGFGDLLLVCNRGRSRALPSVKAQSVLAAGGTLGLCVWQRSR